MASFSRDATDKAVWSQMAERWLSCAEHYDDQRLAHDTNAEMRRRRAYLTARRARALHHSERAEL
jgi:hypothetical protein